MAPRDRNSYDEVIKDYAPVVKKAADNNPILSKEEQEQLEWLTAWEYVLSGGISKLQNIIAFIKERLLDSKLSSQDRDTYRNFLENIQKALSNNAWLRNKVIGQATTDLDDLLKTMGNSWINTWASQSSREISANQQKDYILTEKIFYYADINTAKSNKNTSLNSQWYTNIGLIQAWQRITLTGKSENDAYDDKWNKTPLIEVTWGDSTVWIKPLDLVTAWIIASSQAPIQNNNGPSDADKKKFIDTRAEVEKSLRASLTGTDLIANLESVGKLTDPISRHFAMQYIWGQIANAGYSLNIVNNKVELLPVKNISDAAKTTELERALSTSLERNLIKRADIEQAIIVGSGPKLKTYLDTTAKWAVISTDSYTKFLLESYVITGKDNKAKLENVEKNANIPENEKAYLRSSLGGNMQSVDMGKVSDTYNKSVQAGVDLFSSRAYATVAKLVGNTVPSTPAQAQAMATAVASNPNTPATADGKPISWIVGGILALFGLGYSKGSGFSLWTGLKRAFIWVVAVVAWCAVGKEWKAELGFDVCDEAKKLAKDAVGQWKAAIAWALAPAGTPTSTPATGTANSPAAQPAATVAPANAPQETPSQRTASDLVRNDQRIKDRLEKQKGKSKNATLDEYIDFINKDCKEKKMEVFLPRQWANDDSISIFADSSNIDKSIALRPNLDPLIWKDIMRLYITGHSIPNSELLGSGYAKHKQNLEAFQKKDWTSDNTLIEALPKIHK